MGDKMTNLKYTEEEKRDEELSFKSAMFNSLIFVGGGLVFFGYYYL